MQTQMKFCIGLKNNQPHHIWENTNRKGDSQIKTYFNCTNGKELRAYAIHTSEFWETTYKQPQDRRTNAKNAYYYLDS